MTAVFSPCRTWRYVLTRSWQPPLDEPMSVLFVLLNPSTADETDDDPTVRRCIGFARSWGYSDLTICNLFAYRATNPRTLRDLSCAVAVGPENDAHLEREARRHELVVAAWGVNGRLHARGEEMLFRLAKLAVPLAVIRWTQGRFPDPPAPAHPLYLPKTLTPQILTPSVLA